MRLESRWADFARGSDGLDRVLLAFPLPGARRGKKHYYVYMRFPSATGAYRLDKEGRSELKGWFEQTAGHYPGVARFNDAMLDVHSDDEHCSGQFVAVCEDGTGLEGKFDARRNDWLVEEFEEEHEEMENGEWKMENEGTP